MIFLVRKALENYQNFEEVASFLSTAETTAAAYFILNAKDRNVVIEKNRISVQGFYQSE